MADEGQARKRGRAGVGDRVARKAVQLGFLLLFLYPFLPIIYKRVTFKPGPTLTSWLLPWDPLLFLGHLAHRDWSTLVFGAPLLVLALSVVLGRFFCGWVCPLGTLLDLVRPVAWWQRRDRKRGAAGDEQGATPGRWLRSSFPLHRNSPVRYYLLVIVLVAAFFSLQPLGVLDPLVIFQRVATVVTADIFALQRPMVRLYLSASLMVLGIVALELWQPRFWCRHLCPLGALLSLPARWTLLNRRVGERCNYCGQCRRACTMRAIAQEGHDTDYSACHMCLECEGICPQGAVSFGLGTLSEKQWVRTTMSRRSEAAEGQRRTVVENGGRTHSEGRERRLAGRYVRVPEQARLPRFSRRSFVRGLAAGAAGVAVPPILRLVPRQPVIRPPGALPEPEFVRTCIICQECIRVCPTGGLVPTVLQAGLAGAGTPQLLPRKGGCSLNPSCPHLCAQVCPAGAIRPIRPAEMRIGVAQVNHSLCLAWDQGTKCLVCVEACLAEAALSYDGRVTVDPNKCTGCGRCEQACPVVDSAIRVVPRITSEDRTPLLSRLFLQ